MYIATPTSGGGLVLAGLTGFFWSAMLGASLIVVGIAILGITRICMSTAELQDLD